MEKTIKVGARASPLSKAQALEVLREIQQFHPGINFDYIFLDTQGDKDLNTSLRGLERTDFFTKEVDHLLLAGKCQIAIHSAKDLPTPLPEGLSLIALTKGVDPADVVVFRQGEDIHSLSPGSIIATSSDRREEAVKKIRSDLRFIDLRGTIEQRLAKLITREADGVVVAEAALIRLGITQVSRCRLPGVTVQNQGKLAVLARSSDEEMAELFRLIDTRSTQESIL